MVHKKVRGVKSHHAVEQEAQRTNNTAVNEPSAAVIHKKYHKNSKETKH
jgi:hypothetical protein